MLDQPPQIPSEWLLLVKSLTRSKGLILILGTSATGKTTLGQYLLEKFYEAQLRIFFIDGDMGQSSIGPPAAIDLVRIIKRPSTYFGSPISHLMYFIGLTSPQGHSLETLVGLKKLLKMPKFRVKDIEGIEEIKGIEGIKEQVVP